MSLSRTVRLAVLLLLAFACRGSSDQVRTVEIATTTSLQGSGLLDIISREFQRDSGMELRAFVVGSGQAMNLARGGTVDLIITHDPTRERQFVSDMRPEIYRQFMWNDFVVVGPRHDPAHVRQARSAAEAFRRIDSVHATFVSRNDRSGTHMKELDLWLAAAVNPGTNPNYIRMGQAMAYLLRSADELQAYTLSDRATFDQLAHQLNLADLYEGDPILRNVYAVTLLRARDPTLEMHERGRTFAQWLLSPRGRDVIEKYRIAGRQEFFWIP